MPGRDFPGRHGLCGPPEREYVAGHNKLLRSAAPPERDSRHQGHRARSKARITERKQLMRKGLSALAAVGLLATGGVAGCGGGGAGSGSGSGSSAGTSAGKVGVILPDTKSSARWATADQKYLKE